jgi:hypothetical protein
VNVSKETAEGYAAVIIKKEDIFMKRFMVILVGLIFLFVGVAFAQQTAPAPAGGDKTVSDKADTTKKEKKKEDKEKEKKDKSSKETGKSESAGGY